MKFQIKTNTTVWSIHRGWLKRRNILVKQFPDRVISKFGKIKRVNYSQSRSGRAITTSCRALLRCSISFKQKIHHFEHRFLIQNRRFHYSRTINTESKSQHWVAKIATQKAQSRKSGVNYRRYYAARRGGDRALRPRLREIGWWIQWFPLGHPLWGYNPSFWTSSALYSSS